MRQITKARIQIKVKYFVALGDFLLMKKQKKNYEINSCIYQLYHSS